MFKNSPLKASVFIVTPPFTQLNTPYPASAYLKGFLNTLHISSTQADLGIECILQLFSQKGLMELFNKIDIQKTSENSKRILALKNEYIKTIDPVILFLQGKNPNLAVQICSEDFLPQASRFSQLEDLDWAFGVMGIQDKAKHLATLYLEDLSDLILDTVDSNFGFSRYAERLGRSANTFDELYAVLKQTPTYIDDILFNLLAKKFTSISPDLVLISVPFPGNLYAAFRTAQWIKKHNPNIKIAMGGGFPNTELRSLSETRVFEFFDYITLDDGETPVEEIIKNLQEPKREIYKRTFILKNEKVVYQNNSNQKDYPMSKVGTPDYSDLELNNYISVIEIVNPMHKMWSDGRWNKLTLAHGCYWGKCTFCDISLDYIKVYEPLIAKTLCDRIEQLISQTGETGFHFVDEAAPPALMRELALEIIRRKLVITWWTNIRFEKSFTWDLCQLLKASGCVAVSGGLEVASDRLLTLIDKGVTVKQVAKVTQNFTEAGIMVHAYLMYGYPTQTVQETVDSLELVRQLFEQGVLQSAFWHQFALTAHSPIGLNPKKFGIQKDNENIGTFANNDLNFTDSTGINHEKFSFGLKKSLFNYLHGLCFDYPLRDWFEFKIPKTTVVKNYIETALNSFDEPTTKPSAKIIWLGSFPIVESFSKNKKGNEIAMSRLTFHTKTNSFNIELIHEQAIWLNELLIKTSVFNSKPLIFSEIITEFELKFENFTLFWHSNQLNQLKNNGLLLI